MITLERLEVVRFKGVRGVALDLPARGAVLIEGRNEAGKSTLFEAVHFGLYGRPLVGALGDAIPHDADTAEVSVRVRIDAPGSESSVLDITRTISRGTAQAIQAVRLRVERDAVEVEEVRRTNDANRRIAAELGGLTADTFVNSCFVPQKQLAGLETLDRSQREAAVAALLNLDRLTRAAQGVAPRPADTEEVRRHEARVELAAAAANLSGTEARRDRALATLRRLDMLDAQDAFDAAGRRLGAAHAAGTEARRRREASERTAETADRARHADTAWGVVATAARACAVAADAATRSAARRDESIAAQGALPGATATAAAAAALEGHVAAVVEWTTERRRLVVDQLRAVETRRAARGRSKRDVEEASSAITAIDVEIRELAARRDALQPRLEARERARARRDVIDALREAVATREVRVREAAEVRVAIEARAQADAAAATARNREAVAAARVAQLERDRDAVVERARLATVREALMAAIVARDAAAQARDRNERLRNLVLGVLDATPTPGPAGGLALRLVIDHPTTGARVIALDIGADSGVAATDRPATDDERDRARDGTIPSLVPADLHELEAMAAQARTALEPLGEAPPTTTRGARERLLELDGILATSPPAFDAIAHGAAVADRESAKAEARMHGTTASGFASPDALARRSQLAAASAEAVEAAVARHGFALGLVVGADATEALAALDEMRRATDAELEETAVAAGAVEAAQQAERVLAGRREPMVTRLEAARTDLALDDDDGLDRAEASARAEGRAGDAAAIAAWRAAAALAGAHGLDFLTSSADGGTVDALPARESVTSLAAAARSFQAGAAAILTGVTTRADGLAFETAGAERDAARARDAVDALGAAVRAASQAIADVAGAEPPEGAPAFGAALADAVDLASAAAAGAGIADRETEASDLARRAGEVAEAFARLARLVDALGAPAVIEASLLAERQADRDAATAQAEADAAWRAATDAAASLGESLDASGALPAAADRDAMRAALPDRASAVAVHEAVIADAGAASEAIAAARRVLGAEEALDVTTARARLESARRDHRARERAATILTTTRNRMMAAILPDTQREMARLLPDLTAGRYRFPRLDDRFQLEVFDERKRGWVRRSLYSGGTQDQFSLALRLGFAIAALPREVGTAPGFLFLDEPLSSFDRERTRALVDLLRDPQGIVGTHFRQVFLVSHSQAFDPGLFPFHVEMEDGRVTRTTLPERQRVEYVA